MFTLSFWQDLAVRAVKTFAQTLAALLVADGTDLLSTDWGGRLSIAGMAALVSCLTTLGSGALAGTPAIGEAVTPDDLVQSYTDESTPTGVVAGPASAVTTGFPVQPPVPADFGDL